MAIAYSCPHCGKQFSVAEQYAGQSGPCAGCGKTITIPPAAGLPAQPYAQPASSGGGIGLIAMVLGGCLVASVCVVALLVALLLPAVQAAREAARQAQASNHLRQLGLAMHNYHDVYNCFPPAVVTDKDGKPLYSGRVLLLPYLEQAALYEQFDKDEPWDSPANMPLSQTDIITTFTDPSSAQRVPGQTDFLFVVGKGTLFDPPEGHFGMAKIIDGTSNTIMMVEIANSGILWSEPRDLDISQPMSLPPSSHANGNMAVFYDGHTQALSKNTPPETVRNLSTSGGGEQIGDY